MSTYLLLCLSLILTDSFEYLGLFVHTYSHLIHHLFGKPNSCYSFVSTPPMITITNNTYTLGKEILAGRNFGGNKIWRNWREFHLADAKKC